VQFGWGNPKKARIWRIDGYIKPGTDFAIWLKTERYSAHRLALTKDGVTKES
jgi:hypothetical protein